MLQEDRRAPPAPEWIAVDGGAFMMGGGPRKEENPRHLVDVPPFLMARTQVTRDLYARFLEETGHAKPPFWHEERFAHPRMPVVGASWHDAEAFCGWAEKQWGEPVRLPSEAEWERAARAGRDVVWPWGDDGPEGVPDYDRRWLDAPEPVDSYPSDHPLGILGLGQNVHEWCADWFDPDYYAVSPKTDPRGPARGRRRSARGGSWRHAVRVSRCAARSSIPPDFRYNDFGFRLVRSV